MPGPSRWSRLSARRRIVVGLADQAVSSFGNFFVILVALRVLDPVGVGRFTIAQLIFVTALGIEQAMVGDILLVAGVAGEHSSSQRRLAREAASAAVVIGLAAAAVYVPIGVVILQQPGAEALLLGLLAVPLVLQDCLRYFLVSTGRAGRALLNDTMWTATLVIAVAVGAAGSSPTPVRVLLIWLVPGGCCAVVAMFQARSGLSRHAAVAWFRRHRQVSRRFLVEYVSITGSIQLVVYTLAGTAGLAASGALRGATALFGPLHTVFTGAKLAVVPELARLRTTTDARRASNRISGLLGASAVLYGGALVALPHGLGEKALGANFALLAPLFPLLAIHKVADAVATGPFTVLRSQEQTRRTAQGRVVVAVLGVLGGVTGAFLGDATGAEIGLAGASVAGCLLWRLMLAEMKVGSAGSRDGDAGAVDDGPLPAGFRVLKVGRTRVVALPMDRRSRRLGVALTKAISRREEIALAAATILDRLGAWRIVSRPFSRVRQGFDPEHRRALARLVVEGEQNQLSVVAFRSPRDETSRRSYLYLSSPTGRHRFAKLVSGTAAQQAVRHEHQVLSEVSGELRMSDVHVPLLSKLYELDHASSVLVSDALPADCRPAVGSMHLVERLVGAYATVRSHGTPTWLRPEALAAPEIVAALRRRGLLEEATAFRLDQPQVALGRVHGDLTPANSYTSRTGWWLIDWERSLPLAPVATDFFLWPDQDTRGLIDEPSSPALAALPRVDRVAAALTAVLLREKLLIPAQLPAPAHSQPEPVTT